MVKELKQISSEKRFVNFAEETNDEVEWTGGKDNA